MLDDSPLRKIDHLDMLKDDLFGNGIADHVIHLRYTSEDLDDSMTAKQMYRDIKEKITDSERYYLLLDEVQEVDGWKRQSTVCWRFQTPTSM